MRSKEYMNNTRKLIRTHKRLHEAYLMFAYETEYSEETKRNIVRMCKHIVKYFGESEEEEND